MTSGLFRLWLLASICCVIFFDLPIIEHWPNENTIYSRPAHWEREHPECLERFRFWPDGSRIEDKDKDSIIYYTHEAVRRYFLVHGGKETPEEAAKDDWLRDVRDKIAECETAQWRPVIEAEVIQDHWLRLIFSTVFTPLLLIPVCSGLVQIWGLAKRHWPNLPEHLRTGLPRVYFVDSKGNVYTTRQAEERPPIGKESRKWRAVMLLCLAGIMACIVIAGVMTDGFSKEPKHVPDWIGWPLVFIAFPSAIIGKYAHTRYLRALWEEQRASASPRKRGVGDVMFGRRTVFDALTGRNKEG